MVTLKITSEGYAIPSKTIEGVTFTFAPITLRKKLSLVNGVFSTFASDTARDVFSVVDAISGLVSIADLEVVHSGKSEQITDLRALGEVAAQDSENAKLLDSFLGEVIMAFCEYLREGVVGGVSVKK